MTRRRWIADEFSENQAALIGEHADHLIRVLRARIGQEFDIAAGPIIRRGSITHIADTRVDFELGDEIPAATTTNLTLLLSIFKFDRMEWAIEKCTELGVSRIVPVIARRTDAHLASAASKRVERWRKIAFQAAEQSRRASPPEIADPVKLKEAANCAASLKLLLAESENQIHFTTFFQQTQMTAPLLSLSAPKADGPTTNSTSFSKADGFPPPSGLQSSVLRQPPSPQPQSVSQS